MPRSPDRDTMLVEGLRRNEGGALEQFAERYMARTYRLAHAITRSHPDAEEVVQDVLLSVWYHIGSFETRARFSTWLHRIAVNAALNKNRRGRANQRSITFGDIHDRSGFVADRASRPDVEFARAEVRRAVRRALRELPAKYQAVVLLREFEELSNEEAAKALGESVGAIKSRLHRARMALREQLGRVLASTT